MRKRGSYGRPWLTQDIIHLTMELLKAFAHHALRKRWTQVVRQRGLLWGVSTTWTPLKKTTTLKPPYIWPFITLTMYLFKCIIMIKMHFLHQWCYLNELAVGILIHQNILSVFSLLENLRTEYIIVSRIIRANHVPVCKCIFLLLLFNLLF